VAAANKDEDVLATVGANIRRERTARSITQERLAEMADLNIRTVQKIESGSLNVLITTLVRIQRGLGCRWDKLLPPPR
jgi:transcriptional regulator with XRE-family HTH domain